MQSQVLSSHPALLDYLLSEVRSISYPAGVMEDRSGRISGPGFFPGATGLGFGSNPLPSRPIMVLGQDQDNQKGHKKSEGEAQGELYSQTWTNMTATFKAAGIDRGDCFFTNFIMGVRVESKRNTGPSPALAHPAFMETCCKLFIQQLASQQPQVIISLGMIPFKLLSLVSSGLRLRSIGIDSYKELDARRMSVIPDVQFDALPSQRFTVVPICHPSYKLNGPKRFAANKSGYKSEVALLKHVKNNYLKKVTAVR
jgi:uracil-DNA glycosylase